MSAKNTPRAAPVAAVTGALVAIAFIALAVVGVRDLFVTQKWTTGHAWSRGTIDSVNHSTRADWVMPLAVLALVVGAALLYVSFKPRRATHERVPSEDESADVWIAPAVLRQLITTAGQDVPGVLHVHPKVSRRRIRVRLQTTPGADHDQIRQTATDRINERIGDLSELPVKVDAQEAKA